MLFSYAAMIEARMACVKRFGSIFDLPVLEDIYSPLHELEPLEGTMLDFGSGPNRLKTFCSERFPSLTYTSLDTDPTYVCDYTRLEDIPQGRHFRLIIANQVLEHLALEDGLIVMAKLSSLLEENGALLVTVPNVAHSNRFRGDPDHKTYLSYPTLYYLASHANLDVKSMYKYSKRKPCGFVEKFFAKHIGALYRIDWADSIAMLAVKKGDLHGNPS